MFGSVSLLNGNASLPPRTSFWISPSTFSVQPGTFVMIDIIVETKGLIPGSYLLDVAIEAETSYSLKSAKSMLTTLAVSAVADPAFTKVEIVGLPTVGQSWAGIQIVPYDSDGYIIANPKDEDFSVSIEANTSDLTANCVVKPIGAIYEVVCAVPVTDVAGSWNLAVELNGAHVLRTNVRMQCAKGRYEDPQDQQCRVCPTGSICTEPGAILESLKIKKGHWRSGGYGHVALC